MAIRYYILSIIFPFIFLNSICYSQASEFPASFFGIEINKVYPNEESFNVEIIGSYIGKFSFMSVEDHFKPKKERPMFPIFRKEKERAYNYIDAVYDITSGIKPPGLITLAVGWKIEKPFNGKYSYINKMKDICEMFKKDLEGTADIVIDYEYSQTSIKNLLDKNNKTQAQFFPSKPIEERKKKYKTYIDYVFDHTKIRVLYEIEPLYKGGPVYESLYVQLESSKNSYLKAFNAIKVEMKEINSKKAKENTEANRPY